MNLTYGNINKFAKLATPMPGGMVNTLPAENERSLAYGKISKMMQRPTLTPEMNNNEEHHKEHKTEKEFATSMAQHTLLHGLGLSHFAIFLEIGEKIGDTLSDLREMKMKAQHADAEIALGNQANLDFSKKMTMALSKSSVEEDKDKKKKAVYTFGKMKM